MTDYTEGGEKVVLSNNTVGNGVKIENIENLDALLEDIRTDVEAATADGFFVPLDAYFFIVPAKGGVVKNMSFAIGDLDGCIRPKKGSSIESDLLARNIDEAKGALMLILVNHLGNHAASDALRTRINEWSDDVKAQFQEARDSGDFEIL